MKPEDLACLETYLRARPELEETISLESLQFVRRGTRKRILEVLPLRSGIQLMLQGGETVRLERPGTVTGSRQLWKTQILELLRAAFPAWKPETVLDGTDRLRHQSAGLLRVLLRNGRMRLPCVAAYPENARPESLDRTLTSLLLWWDRLQEHELRSGALLLVPEFYTERLLQHLPYLNLPVRCFKYRTPVPTSAGQPSIWQIYPRDVRITEVRSPYVLYACGAPAPRSLESIAGEHRDLALGRRFGVWELSYLGLPVAWQSQQEVFYDCIRPKRLDEPDDPGLIHHLQQVRRLRRHPPPAPRHPYYKLKPERWLESLVVQNHRMLNSEFLETIYTQVPSFVDGDRKVLDLLTATRKGRLAVVELKVEKDLELVFQALEYWERVRAHAMGGDFREYGYFPGTNLLTRDPLLYLVSPLFEFHRVMPVLRAHLRESVVFECIGIPADWRKGIHVIRRFRF